MSQPLIPLYRDLLPVNGEKGHAARISRITEEWRKQRDILLLPACGEKVPAGG